MRGIQNMKKVISLILALCMILSFMTVVSAKTIYENIPFNGQGNSKTFLVHGEDDYNYKKFIDYISTIAGTITDAGSYKPYAILVAPDGILQDDAIAFDKDGNWVVEGVPNKVNTNEKAIKVQKVTVADGVMSDVEKAQLDLTQYHNIDIAPAKYSRIYVFAASIWSDQMVNVTITYADNTTETKTITVMQTPYPDFKPWTGHSVQDRNDKGYTISRPPTSTTISEVQSSIYFYPYCVTTNPNKEIVKIGFTATSSTGVTIISLTGVRADVEDIVDYAMSVEAIDEKTYEINKFFPQQAKEFLGSKESSAVDALAEKIETYEAENNIVSEEVKTEEPEEMPEYQEPVTKPEMAFEDLDSVSWAKEAIKYLYDNNIASGTSDKTFSPNDHLTREQFVKIICGAFNVPSSSQAVSFKDVKKGAWYEPFVKDACGAGLVSGTSKDTFGVGQKITRQDLAVIIYRAVGDKIKAEGKAPVFNDKKEISGYAVPAVTVLSKAGIINGSDGNFNPKNYCTRAEMAKIVYGVIANIGEEATK